MGPVDFDADDVVLHKMHGSIDQPKSLVITRSDYVRYLATLSDRDVGMPDYFWKVMIPQRTLLFLGYSLADWNFQAIWEGVLAALKYDPTLKDTLAREIDSQPDWASIRENWYLREVLVGQAHR